MGNSLERSVETDQENNSKNGNNAIIYQSLFLMNLLLIPGLSFLALMWLLFKRSNQKGWQRIHLYRSVQLSILAGFLLLLVLPSAELVLLHSKMI